MKKLLIAVFMLGGLFMATEAKAQYKPTKKDIGKDCTTQEGKLGTWKNVRVEDGSAKNQGESRTNAGTIKGSVGVKAGSASGSYSHSGTNSRGTQKSEKISYEDIRCVEDKNATLPQRSPVRW